MTTQFENQGRHRFHNLSTTITHFHNGTLNAVRGEQQVGFYYVFADYIYSVLEYDVVLIDGLSVFRISFLSLASGYANASTMLGRISSFLLFVNYPGD